MAAPLTATRFAGRAKVASQAFSGTQVARFAQPLIAKSCVILHPPSHSSIFTGAMPPTHLSERLSYPFSSPIPLLPMCLPKSPQKDLPTPAYALSLTMSSPSLSSDAFTSTADSFPSSDPMAVTPSTIAASPPISVSSAVLTQASSPMLSAQPAIPSTPASSDASSSPTGTAAITPVTISVSTPTSVPSAVLTQASSPILSAQPTIPSTPASSLSLRMPSRSALPSLDTLEANQLSIDCLANDLSQNAQSLSDQILYLSKDQRINLLRDGFKLLNPLKPNLKQTTQDKLNSLEASGPNIDALEKMATERDIYREIFDETTDWMRHYQLEAWKVLETIKGRKRDIQDLGTVLGAFATKGDIDYTKDEAMRKAFDRVAAMGLIPPKKYAFTQAEREQYVKGIEMQRNAIEGFNSTDMLTLQEKQSHLSSLQQFYSHMLKQLEHVLRLIIGNFRPA